MAGPQEISAAVAFKKYLGMGPDIAYGDMVPEMLESLQTDLSKSRNAVHQHAAGWLAIERSLAISSSGTPDGSLVSPLFEQAEEGFTNALDLYDEQEDRPSHLWKVEIDMAAMPLYYSWVIGRTVTSDVLKTFQGDLKEAGKKLLALSSYLRHDTDAVKAFNGLNAEIVTMLAYNRSLDLQPDAQKAIGIPSTMRQDLSVWPGRAGNTFTKKRLRGNWDVTTIAPAEGAWEQREKLQVKFPSWRSKQYQNEANYHPSITPLSIVDHLACAIPMSNVQDVLRIFLKADESRSPEIVRHIAAYMTDGLHEQIAAHRATLQA